MLLIRIIELLMRNFYSQKVRWKIDFFSHPSKYRQPLYIIIYICFKEKCHKLEAELYATNIVEYPYIYAYNNSKTLKIQFILQPITINYVVMFI